jgi:ankyrin repeat protein
MQVSTRFWRGEASGLELAMASERAGIGTKTYGNNSLHQAAIRGDIAGIDSSLNAGIDINSATSDYGYTALDYSIIHCQTSVMRLLVRLGANITNNTRRLALNANLLDDLNNNYNIKLTDNLEMRQAIVSYFIPQFLPEVSKIISQYIGGEGALIDNNWLNNFKQSATSLQFGLSNQLILDQNQSGADVIINIDSRHDRKELSECFVEKEYNRNTSFTKKWCAIL